MPQIRKGRKKAESKSGLSIVFDKLGTAPRAEETIKSIDGALAEEQKMKDRPLVRQCNHPTYGCKSYEFDERWSNSCIPFSSLVPDPRG